MPALGVVFRNELQGVKEQEICGKGLFAAYNELVQAAKDSGVAELAEFTDMADDYAIDPSIFPPDFVPPPQSWHSASDGLITVRASIGYIETHAGGIPSRELAMADLNDLRILLETAERQGIGFNLYWDI